MQDADRCFEDDDEERTLSTDTYFIDTTVELQPQEAPKVEEVVILPEKEREEREIPPPAATDRENATKRNNVIFDLTQKFDKMIENKNSSASSVEFGRPVKKSSAHVSRIQKQFSNYEMNSTHLPREPPPPMRHRSHRSVDRMDATVVPPPIGTPEASANLPSTTRSCVNLLTRTKGALIVKEDFIEPPKRVQSFHGRTDLLKQNAKTTMSSRFHTTLVKEGQQQETNSSSGKNL